MHVIQVPYVRFLKITKLGEINLVLYIIGMLPLYGMICFWKEMMVFFFFLYLFIYLFIYFFIFIYLFIYLFIEKAVKRVAFFKILVPIH